MIQRVKKRIVAMHRDTRGAISILVLLTIWCLVAILGLIWNTAEEAKQRAVVQTAADSAAHAAGVWMARTGNAITAQNMVICQDASAETVWRGITPTDQAINNRLNSELAAANQMKQQQLLQNQMRRIQQQLVQIAADYQLTSDALANLRTGTGANFSTPAESIDFANKLRQVDSVRMWVMNTYVNGQLPPVLDASAPPRPGPPGPNGEGLMQLINSWQPATSQNAILDYIINFINTTERPFQTAFENRTAYAVSQPVDVQMASHESRVYANEVAMVQELPAAIEAQRQQIADFYKVDVTLATLKHQAGATGPAQVTAPYMRASEVQSVTGHVDSIRMMYPIQTAQAGLSPIVTIDGLSPHTNENRIWHPDLIVPVPASMQAQYPGLADRYTVTGSFPGGWGHIYTMPLAQYFQQRVAHDLEEIDRTYMQPLDVARSVTLAQVIRQMMGVPLDLYASVANLPGTIPDDQREPVLPGPPLPPGTPPPPPPPPAPPVYDTLYVLPRLAAPSGATAAFRTQVDLYNTNGAKFTSDVRELRTLIINYAMTFQRFVTPFAGSTWQTNVNGQAISVFEALGQKKQFMLLSTYGLRPIPEWAKPGMYDSVVATVENQVLTIAMMTVSRAITSSLTQTNTGGVGGGILDPTYLQTILTGAYAGQGAQVADTLIRPAAHQIAVEIATEWINRPWPYEISPPMTPVPPARGVLPDERMQEFTVLAAARQNEAAVPRLVLPTLFFGDSTKLVAYGQGEMFNWMEFNSAYGAQTYDQVVTVPELVYRLSTANFSGFVGSPRGWRVASLGGWEWRSRLSFSDSLYLQLQNNPELSSYFNDAGVSSPSRGALDAINLH